MPWALIAIAAIQAGFAIHQAREQKKAAEQAAMDAAQQSAANQQRLTLQQQRARRQAQGTVLGGATTTGTSRLDSASVLSSTPQSRSLLGG